MKKLKNILAYCLIGTAFTLNANAQEVQGFVHEQSAASDYV